MVVLAYLFTKKIQLSPKGAIIASFKHVLLFLKTIISYRQFKTINPNYSQIFLALIPPSQSASSPPPPSAYLYLAQLTDDDPKTALSYYQHAVDVLLVQLKGKERAIDAAQTASDEAELRGNIVRAYVGMVEIWMDPSYDLW